MKLGRRTVLRSAAFAPGLALPGIARSKSKTTLRFIPVIDLAFLDPIYSPAQVSRNHGFMVFDTLYGIDRNLEVSPQMVEGHRMEDDGKRWDLRLRDGLFWHDGERVLARDCVASIRRWSRRDAFGDALMKAADELSAPDDRTIRFRLKRPFPLLPMALGKAAVPACFMMPERLANTDPAMLIPEVIGSGPFRFKADERMPGALNVYERFDRYKPRENGTSDWTAGPKVVHYDRVEWTTTPDAASGAAAVEAGEQDWMENAPHDLLPILTRKGNLTVDVLDKMGYCCSLRVNHLHPPFDNPAVRRALWGALDQSDFMTAVTGGDPAYQTTPIGFFCPDTPMASDVGLGPLSGPRDYDKVKRDLKVAGYNGEKVVVLVPMDSQALRPLGNVAADMLRRAGMKVDFVGLSFGAVTARRARKEAPENGGWSAFASNGQGMDWLDPGGSVALRADGNYIGWAKSERIESLRDRWLATGDLAEQRRICAEIQAAAFDETPFYPIGQYRQATVYRKTITGVGRGTATFWNVRPA